MIKKVNSPLTAEAAESLRAGDAVLLSGTVYVARDAAHERLTKAIKAGGPSPIPLKNATIFYAGPAPTPPNAVIGPIGPTTSGRMDRYTPFLLDLGVRAMIGKGKRSPEVLETMKRDGAVYFGATGGTAVLLSSSVKKVEPVAYDDLGPEAIIKLEVEDMPLIVLADCCGGDIYNSGQEEARRVIAASRREKRDV